MTFTITESERREILGLYGIVHNEPTPLQKLRECKYTTDGKFVIFEGIGYSCETGEQIPINEAWTTSDTLHTIADVASGVVDYIVPGSGVIIDGINAMSYFIEAYRTNDPTKRHSLNVMGGVTLAFVFIPGVLQALSIPLKQFLKGNMAAAKNPAVIKGIALVGKYLGDITQKVPAFLDRLLATPMGRKILGPFGRWLAKYIANIMTGVRIAFKSLDTSLVRTGAKTGVEGAIQAGSRVAARGTLNMVNLRSLTLFARAGDRLTVKEMTKLFKKIGFAKGKKYTYMGTRGPMDVLLKEITEDEVLILTKYAPINGIRVNTASFLSRAIGAPWLRRGKSVAVPFFVKRFANILLPDGNGVNEESLDQLPDADPEQTSQESLSYVSGGDETNVTQSDQTTNDVQGSELYQLIQPNPSSVMAFQNALMGLGYNLPQYGVDGKFGSETQGMLSRFQSDYSLESSSGKMDRLTAKTLATALKNKNVQDSQSLQKTLYSM